MRVRRANAFVTCFRSLRLLRFAARRRTGWLSLGTSCSRAALLAVAQRPCSSDGSRSRRFQHRAASAIGASNPSFERTASGSRSIPSLGAPMRSSQTSVRCVMVSSTRAVIGAAAVQPPGLSPSAACRPATPHRLAALARSQGSRLAALEPRARLTRHSSGLPMAAAQFQR